MDWQTAAELLEINRRFYSEFGDAFAATRRRIQPGVSRVLDSIPKEIASDWLDLGCGSGALGQIWSGQQRCGSYTVLDFSGLLLREGPGKNYKAIYLINYGTGITVEKEKNGWAYTTVAGLSGS